MNDIISNTNGIVKAYQEDIDHIDALKSKYFALSTLSIVGGIIALCIGGAIGLWALGLNSTPAIFLGFLLMIIAMSLDDRFINSQLDNKLEQYYIGRHYSINWDVMQNMQDSLLNILNTPEAISAEALYDCLTSFIMLAPTIESLTRVCTESDIQPITEKMTLVTYKLAEKLAQEPSLHIYLLIRMAIQDPNIRQHAYLFTQLEEMLDKISTDLNNRTGFCLDETYKAFTQSKLITKGFNLILQQHQQDFNIDDDYINILSTLIGYNFWEQNQNEIRQMNYNINQLIPILQARYDQGADRDFAHLYENLFAS